VSTTIVDVGKIRAKKKRTKENEEERVQLLQT